MSKTVKTGPQNYSPFLCRALRHAQGAKERHKQILVEKYLVGIPTYRESIGTMHLLMGVLKIEDCIPRALLSRYRISHEKIQARIAHQPEDTALWLREDSSIMDTVFKEAQLFQAEIHDTRLAPEHILMGLLRVPPSCALSYLKKEGVSVKEVEKKLYDFLGTHPPFRVRFKEGLEELKNKFFKNTSRASYS